MPRTEAADRLRPTPPVLVLPLHGHLAPAAWAASRGGARDCASASSRAPAAALPGALSRDVAELRERGLLAGHVTAGPAYGGEHEAISLVGGARRGAARARLGRGRRRPGAGDPRLGDPLRARRDGGARCRPRRARARPADAGLARGCRAPTRARAIAASAITPRRCSSCSSAPCGCPVPEVELEGWPLLDAEAPDGRLCAGGARRADRRSAAVATTSRSSRSTSTGTRRAGCPRGRWAARSPRTRSSSPRRWRRAGRWPQRRRGGTRAMERDRSQERLRGQRSLSVRIDEFRHPDGATVEAGGRRPSRGRWRSSPTTSDSCLSRPPAARGRGRGGAARAARRQARRRRARRRFECAKRELGRGGRHGAPREWRELKRFYTSPGFAEEEVTLFLATGARAAPTPSPRPEERIEIVAWPLDELDGAIDRLRRRRVADRPAAAPRAADPAA